MEPEARVVIPVRITKRAVDQVDRIAVEEETSRSEILRRLLKLGLIAWTKGQR